MPYYDGGLGSGSGDMQNYSNNRYVTYNNRGPQWRGREAHAAWARNNYIDERGQLQGDFQYVPHSLAQVYQGIHDVRTYNYRDQVMRDAVDMSRGAANLMSSYRPGGSAAQEAGIYQQTAALNMQRASMIQPMDLMGDYRRYVNERERQKRETAFRQNLYMGIAAAAGSFFSPQYVSAAKSHFNKASDLYAGDQMGETGYSANTGGGQQGGQQALGAQQGQQANASTISPQAMQALQSQQGQQGQQEAGGAVQGALTGANAGSAYASTLVQDQGNKSVQGGMAATGGQGYGYADGGGGAGGGGGTGAGMGGGGGSFKTGGGIGYQPGADGDFTSNAYARRASMESPYLNTVVGEAAVSKYENDSFYSQLSAEIDYEMYLRRTA